MALIITIFLASLLGSLHCVGMCGAFLAIAIGNDPSRPGLHARTQAAYHLGRLATYVTLGAFAGMAGGMLDLGSALAGIKPVATALAGGMILAFGVLSLLRLRGVTTFRFGPPAFLAGLLSKAHGFAMDRPPLARAGLIGLFTTLLPCGWLYVFVAAAAGTASPLKGALAMGVFWLGTLPALVSLGVAVRTAGGFLGRRLAVITCLAMIVVGLLTLSMRFGLDPAALAAGAFHRHGTQSISDSKAECCVPEGQVEPTPSSALGGSKEEPTRASAPLDAISTAARNP